MSTTYNYRLLVILNGLVPMLVLAWDAYRGHLGANSVNYALHVTGLLSLLFLILSLSMTPLRWLTLWSGWIAFRRSLGLYGFAYSLLHLTIYVVFDRSLSLASTLQEIWMRRFLQVGTMAVFLMIPLAVTSTSAMIQRIGPKRWKLLHRLTYVVAALGVVHYYMLVKSDVRQPVAFAVVLTGLLSARFGHHYYELRKKAITSAHVAKKASLTDSSKRKFWSGELRIGAMFQETPDVKTFRLVPLDGGPLPFDYLPGQYLNLQLTIDGKRVNRSYTIASTPSRRDACELSIKREPHGVASRYLHDELNVGDCLKVSAPAGKFVFTGKESNTVFLIAGGVGITPLMSIVRYLTDRAWGGEIYLLIIAKKEDGIIFREEIEWLSKRFANMHVCITLTGEPSDSIWTGKRGRANAEMLQGFVQHLKNVPTYLCGPQSMMDSTKELLVSLGVPPSLIVTEAFISPGVKEKVNVNGSALRDANSIPRRSNIANATITSEGDQTFTISFVRSNQSIEVTASSTVLESAEELGIELPFECRSGVCGQCMTKLLRGSVIMESEDALSQSAKNNQFILACQSHPQSSVVVDA